MMRDLYTNGPLSIAIELKSDLFTYKSGVYKAGTNGVDCGGHAVNLFGWGVENGVKYWLVQNEWNSGWGDQGYVKVLRGVNEIGIESDASAGLAAFEKPQPKQKTTPKQQTPSKPDNTVTKPDNTITKPDNTVTKPDNTVTKQQTPPKPDNTVDAVQKDPLGPPGFALSNLEEEAATE